MGKLASAGLLVLAAACGTSSSGDGGVDPGFGTQDARDDVELSACHTTKQYGISDVEGTYTIANHSDGTSDYFIELNVERDGVIIGDGIFSADHVGPGQQAQGKVLAILDGDPPAGPCEFVLTTVQRTAT